MNADQLVAALAPLEGCFLDREDFLFGAAIIPPEARMNPAKSVILLTVPSPEKDGYHGYVLNPADIETVYAIMAEDPWIVADNPDESLSVLKLRFVLTDGRCVDKWIEGYPARLAALIGSVETYGTANNPLSEPTP